MTTVTADIRLPFRARHPLVIYSLRRIGIAILLVALVSLLVFAATLVLPGNAVDQVLGRGATAQQKAALTRQLGLDRPLLTQYVSWAGGMLHGDFGRSLASHEAVTQIIGSRVGNSLILALGTLIIMIPVSILLGAIAGVRRDGPVDHAISRMSIAVIAVPEFVSGTILAVLLGVEWAILPPTSILPTGGPLSHPNILVLPILTLCIAGSGYIIRMLRAGVVETMTSDYVQAARLNGIPEGRLIFRHALRNALAPTVQVVALTVQWLVGGIVVTETVFSYPGLGQGLVQAVTARDIPVVQGVTVLLATFYIVVNLVADLAVIMLVPKLRTSV